MKYRSPNPNPSYPYSPINLTSFLATRKHPARFWECIVFILNASHILIFLTGSRVQEVSLELRLSCASSNEGFLNGAFVTCEDSTTLLLALELMR